VIDIKVQKLADLPRIQALECVLLCKQDSEMQKTFRRLARRQESSIDYTTIIAVATDCYGVTRGWLSIGWWQRAGKPYREMQSFVSPESRRMGIAGAMASCAATTLGLPNSIEPIAVFSDECCRIASNLRWNYQQWRRVEDGWITVGKPSGPTKGGEQ
jgi:hypothetical protein